MIFQFNIGRCGYLDSDGFNAPGKNGWKSGKSGEGQRGTEEFHGLEAKETGVEF